jgi:hypothetical protein
MKVRFFTTIEKFLKRDISLTISLLYIVLIAIGMLFKVSFYMFFYINIVEYSDISDFLLAPFRDPIILIMTIGSVLFLYAFNILDDWMEKHTPRLYESFYYGFDKEKYQAWFAMKGMAIMIVTYIGLFAYFYGSYSAKSIKKSNVSTVSISFKDNKFEPSDTLIYMGKTNGYVFLYKKNTNQTAIFPMSDVLKMETNK